MSDNYSGEVSSAVAEVIDVGWKVILIGRKAPVGEIYPILPVEAFRSRQDLYTLFETNLGAKLRDEDTNHLDGIIHNVGGHTLVLELIAKQIAASYLTIEDAAGLVDSNGFASIAPERVVYTKDADARSETIRNIITALFEADSLPAGMKDLLKVMSLMDAAGIDIRMLHTALEIESMDDANALIRDGWMIRNDRMISLHPVIRETIHCREWSARAQSYAVRLMESILRTLQDVREDDLKNNARLLPLCEAILDSCLREPILLKEDI